MNPKRKTSIAEACEIGDQLGVDWAHFDLEEFPDYEAYIKRVVGME